MFQSTLPRRERQTSLFCATIKHLFQSTLPRRERLQWQQRGALKICFNPRSREGSDGIRVSAPVRSISFNPRSREGSDSLPCTPQSTTHCFNPRSREGSDPSPPHHSGSCFPVSIHAPAKGATDYCWRDSNLRWFQSTLPRRERRYQSNWWLRTINGFNPRSREGSDGCNYCDRGTVCVSIHAPAKGAT